MHTDKFEISIGDLGVQTTDNRGHTIEEVAEMATNKLISISDTAPMEIKAQAHAFRARTKMVVAHYIQEGIKHQMCKRCNELEKQGQTDLANIIRRL